MIALLALLSPALPCGGGDYASLDEPFIPAESHVEGWLYEGVYWGEEPAGVATFSYAFPKDVREPEDFVDIEMTRFQGALDRGEIDVAAGAAARVANAVLDLPVADAEPYGDALRLAVEFLEVRPALGSTSKDAVADWFAKTDAPRTKLPPALAAVAPVRGMKPEAAAKLPADPKHPRAASIRWLAIRHALATGIPNGWSADDIRQAAPGGFGKIQQQLDAWLRDYPDHPLADYVRLKKMRLHYLADEADAAWGVALDVYRRHPARAADEMGFLVRQGLSDPTIDLLAVPPEVAAGWLDLRPWTPEQWNALWVRSEADKTAPWALPLQERLLLAAMRSEGPLPSAFPKEPAAPSLEWATLRLAALVRAARNDEAAAQWRVLPPESPLYAPVGANLALRRGDWSAAIRTPGLDEDAVRYLVRVLAPADVLADLADDPDPTLRWEVRMAIASRRFAEDGDWKAGAATIDPVDPERADRWLQSARLAKGKSLDKRLAYARFLRDNGGKIFMNRNGDEVVWYRSLPDEPLSLGEDPGGWASHEDWLTRSFSTWYALGAYADWLVAAEKAGLEGDRLILAREVLGEADGSYNALLNYGSGEYLWATFLPDSAPAREIRDVGREIRAKAP